MVSPVMSPNHRKVTRAFRKEKRETVSACLNLHDCRHSETSTKIEHRDCNKAHRTLGLHPTPTGCQLHQAQELRIKSDRFAAGLAKAPVSQHESRTACWMMWLPSMTCCPPCSYMTKKQLNRAQINKSFKARLQLQNSACSSRLRPALTPRNW